MDPPLIQRLRQRYIGLSSDLEIACDAVEAGAVRRYAQAIGDANPLYGTAAESYGRFGGPIAPPLFPTWMFRRRLGEADPVEAGAGDPDFDGVGAPAAQGLPPVAELAKYATLNGGISTEFFRHARHGERVTMVSRYADITEKLSSKGAMFLVTIASDYRTLEGELLVRVSRTGIRRLPAGEAG